MKKLMLLMVVGIVLLGVVSSGMLGTFAEGTEIELWQTCDDCTYNNITTLFFPNGTGLTLNVEMDRDGTYFNYTLNSNYTQTTGTYIVNGVGNLNGIDTVWAYDFDITPSGNENLTTFLIIFLIIIAGTFILGVSLENNWIMFFAFVEVLFFGFWIIIYGIDIIKNTQTTWAI